jgi:hypothetical protein
VEACGTRETVDFGYSADAPVNAERIGHVMIGVLSVSDLTYDNGAGGRARATLVVPPRPNGTAVILAHGCTADGRHYFLSEATDLANRGMTTLLTAYSLPEEHVDQQATGEGIRTAPYVAVPGRRRLLFQHGRDDQAVFRSEVVTLFEAAAEPRDYREYDADHDTVTPPQAQADRIRLFTSETSGAAPAGAPRATPG